MVKVAGAPAQRKLHSYRSEPDYTVPLLAVDQNDERVGVLELDPEIPPRRISLVWHRDRHGSPAARAFADVAAGVGTEVAASLAPIAA